MTQKVLTRSQPVNRRRERRNAGEVAGNAMAECAAVCCCLPCSVMDMVVLATYKLPAGLVKKAMHKRKRRLLQKKKKKTEPLLDYGPTDDPKHGPAHGLRLEPTLEERLALEVAEEKLEEEMWAQFHDTGFWRSTSQRHPQTGER